MTKEIVLVPRWVYEYFEKNGELGEFVGKVIDSRKSDGFEMEVAEVKDLIKGFVAFAKDVNENGLVVESSNDKIVYIFQDGKLNVFATDEEEWNLAVEREESWQFLSENMPALKRMGLAMMIETVDQEGKRSMLGFPSEVRKTAVVITGELKEEELLDDAVRRELSEVIGIEDFRIMDVLDENGDVVLEGKDGKTPLFTVKIETEWFDPKLLKDSRVGWISLVDYGEKKRVVN